MGTPSEPGTTCNKNLLTARFNPDLVLEPRDVHLSAEVGVLAIRELDERLRLTAKLAEALHDPRNPDLINHPLVELLRSRLYAIIQGWGDQDNLDPLRYDLSFQVAVSTQERKAPFCSGETIGAAAGLASQPTQSRLLAALSAASNRQGLKAALLEWSLQSLRVLKTLPAGDLTLDIDSSMWQVFGHPAGTNYNDHYHCSGYHPHLAYLHEARAWMAVELRMGSEYSSNGAAQFVLPLIADLESRTGRRIRVRGDAAYADEKFMSVLEAHRDATGASAPIPYCFRLKTNSVLNRMANPFLTPPPGRRPREPRIWLHELSYQAEDWSRKRRLVLVVKELPGEMFLDYFFLVTNFALREHSGTAVLAYYRQRGTMEADIGQLKTVLRPSLSSSDRSPRTVQAARNPEEQMAAAQKEAFSNEATLILFLLAYNLMAIGAGLMSRACRGRDRAQSGHYPYAGLREELRKDSGYGWSLGRFREQVLKCAGRFLMGGNRIRVIVSQSGAELFLRFWRLLANLHLQLE